MAERMADIAIRESPEISKAWGARDALISSLSVHGEFAAVMAAEKQATIKANSKLIRRSKRQLDLADKSLEMFARAQDADNLSLQKMTAYVTPSESEIEARVAQMLGRQRVVDSTPKVIARIDHVLSGLNLCQDEHTVPLAEAAAQVRRLGIARDLKSRSKLTYSRSNAAATEKYS